MEVKMSLCLSNWASHHKDVWRSVGIAPLFLTSALVGVEWSAVGSGRFTHREWGSHYSWIGGWVGPRVALDAVEYRKISCPCRELNPGCPVRSPSPYRLSSSGSFCILANYETHSVNPRSTWDEYRGRTLSHDVLPNSLLLTFTHRLSVIACRSSLAVPQHSSLASWRCF
jgi:hypothetical protein